jgi:integral membrane sensor domain MASE1
VTHWRRVKAGEIEEIPKINVKLVVIYTLAVLAYVFLVEVVGYFVATPIFIVGTYMYLRATSLRNALIIAVGFCVLVYVVFIDMLYLPLPMGLLEDVMGR